MKFQTGSVILLVMIFIAVVAGYLVVNTAYQKKHRENYTQVETIHTKEYGDISMERYYRNGLNVKAFGYYKDGSLKSEFYVTDKAGTSSKYVSYFPNRQVESHAMSWEENGKKEFMFEEFFPDGKVRRREGSQLPKWEYYDENGDPTIVILRDGERSTEMMFYPGGQKQEETEFLNGIRDGRWQQWDTTGRQTRNEIYKNGLKVR